MIDATITEFLGWCLVINGVVLLLTSIMLMLFKRQIMHIHHKLMAIEHQELAVQYFRYLANFKIMILIFNLTPYVALKIML